MAKPKKEQKKASPEERLLDRWNQQVFFLKKQFPKAEAKINAIRKSCETKSAGFRPTEEAVAELAELYIELRGPYQSQQHQLLQQQQLQQHQAQVQSRIDAGTARPSPSFN